MEYDEQALILLDKLNYHKGKAGVLGNIGLVYLHLSKYEDSLRLFEQALNIFKETDDINGQANQLINIGIIYNQAFNQPKKAIEYYMQGAAMHFKCKDYTHLATDMNNIGIIWSGIEQYNKAIESYEKALAINKKIKNPKGEGYALLAIGVVHQAMGQSERSLKYLEQALDIMKKYHEIRGEGETLRHIGRVYSNLSQYETSLKYYKQALAIHHEIKAITHEVRDLNGIGISNLALGKISDAEKTTIESIQILESIRKEIHSDKERTGFQSTMPDVYGLLAATRIALGHPDKALEAIEQGRAKSFLDLLGTRATGIKTEKTGQIVQLENQLAALRQNKIKLTSSGPMGKKKRSGIDALDNKISELNKQRLELINQLRREDPELGSLVSVSSPDIKEIQAMLLPGTVLVEYFHHGEYIVSGNTYEQLWIFVVHKNRISLKKVNVAKKHLEETLDTYASILSDEG